MQKGPDIGERIATLANPLGNHKTLESRKKYTSALEAELAERIGTVDMFGSSEIIAFTTIKRLSNTNNQELEIALAAIYRLSTIRNIPQNIRASLLTGKAREIAGIITKDKQERTKYALISYHLDKGQLIVDRVAQTLRLDPINIQIFKKINDSTLVDKHHLYMRFVNNLYKYYAKVLCYNLLDIPRGPSITALKNAFHLESRMETLWWIANRSNGEYRDFSSALNYKPEFSNHLPTSRWIIDSTHAVAYQTLVDNRQLPDFVTEDIAQTNYARHLERIYHQILSQRPTKR